MNAKNHLINVRIPKEDKSKSYSFLLKFHTYPHFASLTTKQCLHTVGTRTLAHSGYSDIR